jgi:CoA-dependent NAD(P)H sulfur oxidoreductase
MKRIAVIGGNAAGPSAAAKAKRVDPNAEVLLFEAGNFISTGTCELPYLISGEIKNHNDIIFYTPESFYEEKQVKVYTKHLVERIDRKEKAIIVKNLNDNSSFAYNYDKLILSTGSVATKHPSFSNTYKNVFYLKNVSDFLKIKNFVNNDKIDNVLIIGGGYIGLETAEAFKNLGKNVTIADKEEFPFPSADMEIRTLLSEIVLFNNVEFVGNVKEIQIFEASDCINKVKFNGRLREYDLILIATGFTPNTQLAVGAQLQTGRNNGLIVDAKLKTSDQNIFAAGDCIEVLNRITNKHEFIPLATLAHSYGHVAGANAAGDNLFVDPVIKNIAVRLFDKILVSVGLNSREADSFGFKTGSVTAVLPNLVKVMSNSSKTFVKLIFDKNSRKILGAQFLGGQEVVGYGNLIASFILQKTDVSLLSKVNYNYSPPCSPFINILSVLGRKIEGLK